MTAKATGGSSARRSNEECDMLHHVSFGVSDIGRAVAFMTLHSDRLAMSACGTIWTRVNPIRLWAMDCPVATTSSR